MTMINIYCKMITVDAFIVYQIYMLEIFNISILILNIYRDFIYFIQKVFIVNN